MKLTTLFRLRKPDGTDPVNIEDFNDNFDVIDEELGKRLESTGAASDMTVAFEQASTRTNLKTGEKISVSFGKIMKWFADLKAVAFSGSYSDLSNKPSIPSGAAASQAVANNCTTTVAGSVLDARQGKVLMDKANQLSSDLDEHIKRVVITLGATDISANSFTNTAIYEYAVPDGYKIFDGYIKTIGNPYITVYQQTISSLTGTARITLGMYNHSNSDQTGITPTFSIILIKELG